MKNVNSTVQYSTTVWYNSSVMCWKVFDKKMHRALNIYI